MVVGLQRLRRPEALRDQAYEVLREQLRCGAIRATDRLTESSVATALGISRTPAREALVLLAREGLLVQTTRGFMVPTISGDDLDEIYLLRRILEPAAIACATEHATRDGLMAMARSLLAQKVAHRQGDSAAFIKANREFRDAWLSMIPSKRLVQAVTLYNDHMNFLRVTLDHAKVRQLTIANLEAVRRAVSAGRADKAARAIAASINDSERIARDLIRSGASLAAGHVPEGRVAGSGTTRGQRRETRRRGWAA